MQSQTDRQLLGNYAEGRSETAFAELVRRHIDLVYSAALRMVRDAHLAEDVTQGVFVALAQNAQQLTSRPILSGWLHRTAQNLAANVVRTDVRRRARESEAATMNQLLATQPDALWEHIAPLLDTALGELSEPDRDALMLRYFERKSAREMAQTLGVSDEAAQKRVTRAVERLRELFAKRGVTTAAGGLAAAISANAVQAAPASLAAAISSAAVLTGGTLTTAATATKAIAMTAFQKSLITAALAIVAGAGIYEARQASDLRQQNQIVAQQQASLAAQMQALQQSQDDATNRLASLQAENAALKSNEAELLRLRGEIQALRQAAPVPTQARTGSSPPASGATNSNASSVLAAPTVPLTPVADLSNSGNSTPRSALATMYWAVARQDTNTFSQLLAWDPDGRTNAEALFATAPNSVHQRFGSIDGVAYAIFSGASPISGFAVAAEDTQGDNSTLTEQHQYADGRVRQNQVQLHHFNDGWRIVLGDDLFMRIFDSALKRAAAAN